jgi:hypothetical protein
VRLAGFPSTGTAGPSAAGSGGELLQCKLPIHQLIEPRVDVVEPQARVIEVIGVLPTSQVSKQVVPRTIGVSTFAVFSATSVFPWPRTSQTQPLPNWVVAAVVNS